MPFSLSDNYWNARHATGIGAKNGPLLARLAAVVLLFQSACCNALYRALAVPRNDRGRMN